MEIPVKVLLFFLMTLAISQASPISYGLFAFPGASETDASGVNNSGVIAGNYFDNSGREHGFIRSADGNNYETITYPGAAQTVLFGINNAGEVLGAESDGSSTTHSFIRNANGVYSVFDVPGSFFSIRGINDSNQVVGSANGRGFIRNSDGVYTFFDVPGYQGNCCEQGDLAINDAGVVAGTVNDAGRFHDFIRSADGNEYVVFDPSGIGNPALLGINNQGELVGVSYTSSGANAFVCSAAGVNTCTTLPAIPFFDNSQMIGDGINDSGEIVGTFGKFGGGPYSFCTGPCAGSLVPSPEIDSLSTTISALVVLFLLQQRKLSGQSFPSWFRRRSHPGDNRETL